MHALLNIYCISMLIYTQVRVSILANGELHYFINGRDIGVAASGLNTSLDYYAVAEVYGQCTGISINGQHGLYRSHCHLVLGN